MVGGDPQLVDGRRATVLDDAPAMDGTRDSNRIGHPEANVILPQLVPRGEPLQRPGLTSNED